MSTINQADLTYIMGAGSWYAQLQSELLAYATGSAVVNADHSFELDKGKAVVVSLSPQQQQMSMDQSLGRVAGMNDTESWALAEKAPQNAIAYIVQNMEQQFTLGVQWLNEQGVK